MPRSFIALLLALLTMTVSAPQPSLAGDEVTIDTGKLSGVLNSDKSVRMFKGIPFAAPPVGSLRWQPPQPAKSWTGVRAADKFGPACMQTDVYGDIFFRDVPPSEDCLNITIWMPAHPSDPKKIPVLVWFYGGGFVAGGNSEKRYDGENFAKKGIMVVSPNYRLGVFGFFSHPELTKESPHHASGNYGLLDQAAALRWVQKNIATFGGDPANVTIAGESAGSASVSGLMASPLSRQLFQRAMGESGAFFHGPSGALRTQPLSENEATGVKFAQSVGATSLAQLRAMSAAELLQAAAKMDHGFAFGPNIDGYFLSESVASIFASGAQSQVPLLAGWNADENKGEIAFAKEKPTAKSFAESAQKRFGDRSAEFLKLYPAATDAHAVRSAEDLAGDDFIAFSTWKWIEAQLKTGHSPVYRYLFAQQVPATKPGATENGFPAGDAGARHAGEIEYVFGTLKLAVPDAQWSPEDFKISEAMSGYWANFVKTGNPNANGLSDWPTYDAKGGYQLMRFDGKAIQAGPDTQRARYEFLDAELQRNTKKGAQ